MIQVIVYLDPEKDLDLQRLAIRSQFPHHEVLEEHVGAIKAAQLSADSLRVPLVHGGEALGGDPTPLAPPGPTPTPQHLGRRKRTRASYEEVRPYFRQAELLGITSLSGIARYLTEIGVPLPSGKAGEWKAAQVKRAKEWLG